MSAPEANRTIEWTLPKLEHLKRQYADSIANGIEVFVWKDDDGTEYDILCGYAKYLIEYLDMAYGIETLDSSK